MTKQKRTDLVGKKFGRLTVIQDTLERAKDGCVIWKCQCDCGNFCEKSTKLLNTGHAKSCGCLHIESARQRGVNSCIDLTGRIFGKLTVLRKSNNRCGTCVKWICKCQCGNVTEVSSQNLLKNLTKSCGCIKYSIGEKNISFILDENNILYKKEYCIKELGNKRFDFAILNNKNEVVRLIEYDGPQHYRDTKFFDDYTLERRKEMDSQKNNWAKEHKIPLVRIPYWERDKITLEMLLGDKYLI